MWTKLIEQFDDRVDAQFSKIRGNRIADRVFYTASALGDFGLIWIIFALLRGLRGGRRNEKAAVRTIAASGIESTLVNIMIKSVIGRHRPTAEVDHPLPFRQPLTSSFPSGHATAAFCAAALLAEGDPLAPVYFATASVVAASRVHVRIHHASDVAGGVLIGLALGLLGKKIAPLRGRHSH